MKALMPRNWTIDPFNTPAAIATVIASATAGQKPRASALPTRMAPARAATEATDKSKLPVIRTTVIATAMKAVSEA